MRIPQWFVCLAATATVAGAVASGCGSSSKTSPGVDAASDVTSSGSDASTCMPEALETIPDGGIFAPGCGACVMAMCSSQVAACSADCTCGSTLNTITTCFAELPPADAGESDAAAGGGLGAFGALGSLFGGGGMGALSCLEPLLLSGLAGGGGSGGGLLGGLLGGGGGGLLGGAATDGGGSATTGVLTCLAVTCGCLGGGLMDGGAPDAGRGGAPGADSGADVAAGDGSPSDAANADAPSADGSSDSAEQ
jgi:hypothetical protein